MEPLVTPIFTRLSQHIVGERLDAWQRTINSGAVVMGGGMVILTLALIWGPEVLIRLIYHHGSCNQHFIQLTSGILPYCAVGLAAMTLIQLLVKDMVSLQHTGSLAMWSLVATFTNIGADVILVHLLQGRGLALGTSLANITYAIGVAYSLHRVVQKRQVPGTAIN